MRIQRILVLGSVSLDAICVALQAQPQPEPEQLPELLDEPIYFQDAQARRKFKTGLRP